MELLNYHRSTVQSEGFVLTAIGLLTTLTHGVPMKTQDFRLDMALHCLNTLIEQGWEFPEAMHQTLLSFAVSQKLLAERYDSQLHWHE
jgi:hypothetical protein